MIVNTHEAKTRLSELIRRACDGEEIIVARNGELLVRLVPWPETPRREPGLLRGQVGVAPGHDPVGSDPDVIAQFESSGLA